MKLSDFVFKDVNFFIDMFVDPSNTESLKNLISGLNIYKWGVSEPGHRGRVVISCSTSGEVQKSSTIPSNPEGWTLFFAFLPETKELDIIFEGLVYVVDIWAEGSAIMRSGGFEVPIYKTDSLVELINAVSET